MILLLTGASHTGKTLMAQALLNKHHIPYLSIDHLKMGLIRSGQTQLSVEDDEKLTAYLWPILREIIKTAIENHQHLILEGCYVPFNWKDNFTTSYLKEIHYLALVMSDDYINTHYDEIISYGNIIEHRLNNAISMSALIEDNRHFLSECQKNDLPYHLIDDTYDFNSFDPMNFF